MKMKTLYTQEMRLIMNANLKSICVSYLEIYVKNK